MMFGSGLIIIFLVVLVLIGIPLLIIALATGGGLAALFRSQPRQNSTPPTPARSTPFTNDTVDPNYVRKCTTCGRGVKADWNVCPSCGATLT